MQGNIHTIVIGSGMAGTGAASQLAKNGLSVLILEANNYIGGRTKTIPTKLVNQKTFCFDEGASWIHGSSKNHPITRLSNQIGKVKAVMTDDDSIINYDQYGKNVDDQVDAEYEQYENLIQRIQDLQGLSAFQAIKKLNGKKLSNKYFMYNVSSDIEFNTSSPLQDLSAQHGQQDSQFKGKQMMVVSGYQAFPEYLSRHENIKVLKNHQVIQIQSTGSKSIVKCSNGKSFQASNIIISVPIGVLKSKSIRFIPELPPWKQEAIQKIHFGNVCKILIVLKNKPINRKEHYIGVVAQDIQKRGCATYFLNIYALTGLPTLMTFGLGANADELEFMPQNQLKELIASRLRVFADKSFSVNDFDIKRTSWRGNPNFRGTYSYSGVETRPQHWENMAKPIFERNMYFCGEHTHSRYRGTVHGAYLSGIDSALYILKNANNKNWQYNARLQDSDQQNQEINQQPYKGRGQQYVQNYNQEFGQEFQGQNQNFGQEFGDFNQEFGQDFYGQYGEFGQEFGQEQGQQFDQELDPEFPEEYGQEYPEDYGQEYPEGYGQEYPEEQGQHIQNNQQVKGRRILQRVKRKQR